MGVCSLLYTFISIEGEIELKPQKALSQLFVALGDVFIDDKIANTSLSQYEILFESKHYSSIYPITIL